jgi:Xaa-Pro aminopeptidase
MSDTAFEPKPLVPALDFDNRMIPAHGTTSVDFEERVDYKRLRLSFGPRGYVPRGN